jgi:hypothetical protein
MTNRPPVPQASDEPQSKKRRLSDIQNSLTPGRGGLDDNEVVDGSGAGTIPNGNDAEDASNGEEDIFDSVHHYSPKDEDLDSDTQALEQDPEVLDSVVFNDADADDKEDASVSQDGKARVEKAI